MKMTKSSSSISIYFLMMIFHVLVALVLAQYDQQMATESTWQDAYQSDDLLSFSYYYKTCPEAEAIIDRKVREWVKKDHTLAPSLLRLHFHDCGVRGCDASILLNHEGSERSADASKSLRGFQVIDDIKAELEKKCPKTVSCADILTAASRDASALLGVPYWTIPFGRKDGKVSIAKEADYFIPTGHENVSSLLQLFQSLDLNVVDLVVLSGAHTIGRSTCGSIQNRLYNYGGISGKSDPSLDDKYANYLKRKCRLASEYVDLDGTTPTTFDAEYYKNLEKKMGLLSTDQLLYTDPRTSPIVNAMTCYPSMFENQFVVSMTKLGNVLDPDVQEQGEIRTNCNFLNSNSNY